MNNIRFCSAFMFLFLMMICVLSANSSTEILIGFDNAFAPYEFQNNLGKADGFNHDLALEITRRTGWKIKFISDKWSRIKGDFDNGKIQLLAGLIITEERLDRYVFSIPHTYIHYSTFQRIGKEPIQAWEDLQSKEVFVQKADVIEEILAERAPDAQIISVENYGMALDKLSEGEGELAILPRLLGHLHMMENKLNNLEISATLDFAYPYTFVSLPANADIIAGINDVLIAMEDDGSLQKLRRKWFASDTNNNGLFHIRFRQSLITMVIFALFALITLLLYLRYYRKTLAMQTQKLNEQIHEKGLINQELSIIHSLYQQGPIIVMKWYDSEKEHFHYITENISNLGYNAADLITGRIHFRDIIHPDDVDAILAESYRNIQSGITSFQQTYRILCPSNDISDQDSPSYRLLRQRNPLLAASNSCQIHWVLDYTVQIYDEEKDISYFYGYLMDVSELYNHYAELNRNRKLAESAEKSKDIFLSSITDEISVPIRSLVETITILTHAGIDEEQQDSLIKLYASANRLSHVINQIQTYLYYSHSAVQIASEWINLKSFLGDYIPLMQARAEAKGLSLIQEPMPDDVEIWYSRKYLSDILGVIFDNAIKFSYSGNILFRYELADLKEDSAQLLLCVTDQGIGIPENKMEYVFKPFTQIDDSYTRERGGLGLGLAILRQIMNISEGNTIITNRSEGGVKVCVDWKVCLRRIN